MKSKSLISLSIVTLVLLSSLAAAVLFSSAGNFQQGASPYIPTPLVGSVTILPDGTVSGTGSSYVQHIAGSNYYNLTGDILGSITILRSGVVFDGQGHSVYNSSSTMMDVINISNANDVSFMNTQIYTVNMTDISFFNSTGDNVDHLTMNTTYIGVMILGNTSHIEVSNSVIYDNLSLPYSAIFSGTSPNASGPLNSSYDSFTNLTVNENLSHASSGGPPVVFIASSNSSFENSTVILTGYVGIGIGVLTNNTVLNNNHVKLMKNGIGIMDGIFNPFGHSNAAFLNNTVINNSIQLYNSNLTPGLFYDGGILANSEGVISKNVIVGNASATLVGITQFAPKSTISYNSITENTTSQTVGLYILNYSNTIENNYVKLNGLQSFGMFLQSYGSNLTKIAAENNTIDATGVSNAYGIESPGSTTPNLVVSSNMLNIVANQSLGIEVNGNYTSILSNTVDVQGYNDTGAFSPGIMYGLNGHTHNVNISKNNLHITALNNTFGLVAFGANDSTVSNNMIQQSLTHGSNSSLLAMSQVNYTKVNGNSFMSNVNYSAFAISLNMSHDDTFYGNSFSGASGLFNFSNANNNLFYHNNFMKYNTYGNSTNSTGNKFTMAYPVGGNYWGPSVTLTDVHSGAGQNLPGSDGIGDSPLAVTAGTDNYPLTHEWTNPTMTFNENGLPKGYSWTINFNGATYATTSQSMTIAIVNGTFQNYSYSAESTSLYYLQQANGTFSYSGTSGSFTFNYVHWAYLNGSVIPSNYTLYLNGKAVVENSTSFNVSIRAGSYELEIISPGYSPYYENFTISSNQTKQINVNFNPPSSLLGLSKQDLYYIGGAAGAVVVAAGAVIALRRRNTGK